MKKIYWRPSKVPRVALLVSAILAIAALSSVELIKIKRKQPYFEEKYQASLTMKKGMEAIKAHRVKRFGPIDTAADPAHSGMIGLPQSLITSVFGHLPAKHNTINPNWAAVMVEMLKKAGLKEGDVAAVGFSGSFPALNLATLAAAEVLKLKVVGITSVAASTWGANIPQFTWLDMERLLQKEGVISHRSVGASYGGKEDMALGRSKKGRELLRAAMERNGLSPLDFETTKENIDERMAIYQKFAEEKPIAAYVNVGGGTVSVGTVLGKRLFKPGLNMKLPPGTMGVDGVIIRFAREGIPVIHMVYIDQLVERYGLTPTPLVMPSVGEGQIYRRIEYNLYLAAANLIILLLVLYAFLKLDIGYRIFGSSRITQPPKHPEPMV
ncbi:MAG: poly-gamma-glutamate system protein [Desulfobacteraceae bacterium]|jgi:poly-gamma-glutamate system protein